MIIPNLWKTCSKPPARLYMRISHEEEVRKTAILGLWHPRSTLRTCNLRRRPCWEGIILSREMLAASFPKTSGRFGSFRIIIAHMLAFFQTVVVTIPPNHQQQLNMAIKTLLLKQISVWFKIGYPQKWIVSTQNRLHCI